MQPLRSYEKLFDTHPLLRLLVPFATGIFAGEQCYASLSTATWALFAAAVVAGAVAIVCHRRYENTLYSLLYVTCLNLAFGCTGAGFLVAARNAATLTWAATPTDAKGLVTAPPRYTSRATQADVRIVGGETDGRTVRLTLMRGDSLAPGDAILFRTTIASPRNNGNPGEFDYAAYLRHNRISGTGFCPTGQWQKASPAAARNLLDALPLLQRLKIKALRLRESLSKQFAGHLQGRSLAVVASITLGDRTHLDDATETLYAQTGISHLLALSGMNVGILFAFYRFLLLRHVANRRLNGLLSLAGLAGLWAFAFITGLPLSLVRATLMFTVAELLSFLYFDRFSINFLAAAAFIMLIAAPQALFDVGFQLSCLSVFAILVLMPLMPRPRWVIRHRAVRFLYEVAGLSLAAQLGTLPIVACVFHTVSVYGLAANLVAVPLSYPLLLGSLAFLAVPFLQTPLAFMLDVLLRAMHAVLEWLATLPGCTISCRPTPLTAVLCYVLFALLLSCLRQRNRLRTVLALGVAGLIAGNELYARRPGRHAGELIFYNLRKAPAVHCLLSEERSYLWTPDTADVRADIDYLRRSFWQAEGISPPHLLVARDGRSGSLAPDHLLRFGGYAVAVFGSRWPRALPRRAETVDFLLVARGARGHLAPVLRTYRPRLIVLDGSLTDFYRRRFASEARAAGLPCHDMAKRGALIVRIGHTATAALR